MPLYMVLVFLIVLYILDKNENCFLFPLKKLPKLNAEKMKKGIFDWAQIRLLMKGSNFTDIMTEIEKKAWNEFV